MSSGILRDMDNRIEVKRLDSGRQQLEENIRVETVVMHNDPDFSNRYLAYTTLNKLRVERGGDSDLTEMSEEEFSDWDTENQKQREIWLAKRNELKTQKHLEIEALEEEDEEVVSDGLREARDKLKKEAIVAKKPSSAATSTAKPKAQGGGGDGSSWDKVYSNHEKKPGKGLIEGVKAWWKMMFGKSEKK